MSFVLWLFGIFLVASNPSGLAQTDHNVEVFDKFDQFAFILEYENDTTYIVNFWATWCKPCVAELPYFENIHHKFKNQKVKVILVSLDDKRHMDRKVKPFLKKNKIQSKVVLLDDTKYNQWIDKVDERWSGSIPATVFYNKRQKLFLEQEFENQEEIENHIHQMQKS